MFLPHASTEPSSVHVPRLACEINTLPCSAQAIAAPSIPGADAVLVEANLVQAPAEQIAAGLYTNHGAWNTTAFEFCNVTVSYQHIGYTENTVHVQVWLPTEDWNGRMVGVGGGAWSSGLNEISFATMTGALSEGYSAVSTDGGHDANATSPAGWALTDTGEINIHIFEDFAYRTLPEAALIGKIITNTFYSCPVKYSYWNGCSTGGRQGLMLAQRFPDSYDGILTASPAINWPKLLVSTYWPEFTMNQLGQYPSNCEFGALKSAAVSACDSLDGVTDGIISDPQACTFSPYSVVGTLLECPDTGEIVNITVAAATVAHAAWIGARTASDGFLWYGLNRDANLYGPLALANVECDAAGNCSGPSGGFSHDWIRYYVEDNLQYDLESITPEDFQRIFETSVEKYSSIIATDNPDLSDFRRRGGKMITWHGLADQIVAPNGTRQYYDSVLAEDPHARDFYRFFQAPGVEHCAGGPGPFPGRSFESLVAWVEDGQAPDFLEAESFPAEGAPIWHRPLCPYPQVARYDGAGDQTAASSFSCEDSYLSATPVRVIWKRFRDRIMDGLKMMNDFQEATAISPQHVRRLRRVM